MFGSIFNICQGAAILCCTTTDLWIFGIAFVRALMRSLKKCSEFLEDLTSGGVTCCVSFDDSFPYVEDLLSFIHCLTLFVLADMRPHQDVSQRYETSHLCSRDNGRLLRLLGNHVWVGWRSRCGLHFRRAVYHQGFAGEAHAAFEKDSESPEVTALFKRKAPRVSTRLTVDVRLSCAPLRERCKL